MNLMIVLLDATRKPVARATVTVSGTATDNTPIVSMRLAGVGPAITQSLKDARQLRITVEHPDYASETINLRRGDDGGWQWDNPVSLVLRVGSAGTDTRVDVLLGRMWLAPVRLLADADLNKDNIPDPGGVLLREVAPPKAGTTSVAKSEKVLVYRSMSLGDHGDFRRLAHPVLDDPDGKEWARFRHVKVPARPIQDGRLYWVEYGSPAQSTHPRMLVALWVPLYARQVNKLDFVIFFTPSTAHVDDQGKPSYPLDLPPFRGPYPYSLLRDGSDEARQPYTRLGHRYLFDFHLVHQLLAADRRAIVVVPIAPALKATKKVVKGKDQLDEGGTHWAPFETPARMGRLLQETCQFVHREMLSSRPMERAIDERREFSGGSVRDRPQALRTHTSPPDVRRVAVSGFSAAYLPISRLLQGAGGAGAGDPLYPPSLYETAPEVLASSWGELWDLDLAKITPERAKAMAAWSSAAPGRHLRMYHSAYTRADHGVGDPLTATPLAKGMTVPTRSAKKDSKVFAHELHGDPDGKTWSSVVVSNEYLNADLTAHDDSAVPEFPKNDPHSFIPEIVLGHAAVVSDLERWPTNPRLPRKPRRRTTGSP